MQGWSNGVLGMPMDTKDGVIGYVGLPGMEQWGVGYTMDARDTATG